MKRSKKKINKTIIFSIILVIGMIVFLYPIVSNIINTYSQTKIISNYEEALQNLSEQEKLERISLAQDYNISLSKNHTAIKDPFSDVIMDEQPLNFINIGDIMGYIEIPKINIKIPIYQGTSEAILQNAIGWLEGTSLPIGGESTHSVLTGHRGLPTSKLFTDLDQLHIGDVFLIYTIEGVLAYQVESTEIISPEEINTLSIVEGKDYITLLTCHPYMINSHRLIVRGERIPYDETLDDSIEKTLMNKTMSFAQKYREYIIICSLFIIFFILVVFIKKIIKKNRK